MAFQIQRFANLSVDLIDVETQVRREFVEDGIRSLAEDIRCNGLLQPIGVYERNGSFVLVFGERRLRAKKLLEDKTIWAAVLNGPADEAEVITAMVAENAKREDLNPIDRAKAYELLKSHGAGTLSEVAQRCGVSSSAVSESLALLDLPDWIQQHLMKGEITSSVGAELSRVKDSSLQAEFAKRILSQGMTRDQLQGHRRAPRQHPEVGAGSERSRATAKLGQGRTVSVTSAELTLDSFISLLEEVLSRAKRVRPRGIELSTFLKILSDEAKA